MADNNNDDPLKAMTTPINNATTSKEHQNTNAPEQPNNGSVKADPNNDNSILPTMITDGNITGVHPATTTNIIAKEAEAKVSSPPPVVEVDATFQDTLQFIWDCGTGTRLLFTLACMAAIVNGLLYPVIAYIFSNSFTFVSGSARNGLQAVRKLAFTFCIVGVYGLIMGFVQNWLFEVVAYRAARSFRLQWFQALLRQETAFYDVYDIGGVASQIGPNAILYRRGVGVTFGEGIQYLTTGVGGFAYAFYSNWRTALGVLCVAPFVAVASRAVLTLNQTKSARAAKAYEAAGSVAYTTVASIKTVLSLNAVPRMIQAYQQATQDAYRKSIPFLWKQGLANGSMLASSMLLYAVVTMLGSFLIYRDVSHYGCDPSGAVHDNTTCHNSGPKVFGAMLGIAFAARGMSQVGNFMEAWTAARVAVSPALRAMRRRPGAPQQVLYYERHDEDNKDEREERHGDGDDHKDKMEEEEEANSETGQRKHKNSDAVGKGDHQHVKTIRAILPAYQIDPSSKEGLKPEHVQGSITFRHVNFAYPTRPNKPVLQDVSIEVPARTTVAIVGPSGGGKSTVAALIERFYDPISGTVEIDGIDIQTINVVHLRSLIGYVGQEPTLFATTIAGNIRYGNLNATQEMIEEAARKANAHDFITSFPDGYNTQVGDKGAQLSGGQKQRIAIARVLVGNPSILLLDEATSALDSESELVVQEALDHVVAEQKRTTIIIAHRLSTIRNADMIVVLVNGQVAEQGTHEELMKVKSGHYRNLIDKQERGSHACITESRESSQGDLTQMSALLDQLSFHGGSTPVFAFKNVVFAYPTRPQKKIFKGLNLTISHGETIAIVGPSGCGKSTTVALIERFYDALEGSIEYMGEDIKSLNLKWYRDQIGYVGQEPTLFNDTIANNIAYGAPSATMDDIVESAKQANAHDFVTSFPEGYNTPVGEHGAQLSGGQKQRIAIARALVKKPMVLLLDEATSALDTESEAIVQAALDNLLSSFDRTTVVIAHRLSTIRNADKIAVIEDGTVKEFGSHEELVAIPKGRYKRLVEAQRRGSTLASIGATANLQMSISVVDNVNESDWMAEVEEGEKDAFNLARARRMASPDTSFVTIGSVGALMAGGVYPMWGLTFGHTLGTLFRAVSHCSPGNVPFNSYGDTCEAYWKGTAHDIRYTSYRLAGYWIIIGVGAVIGNILTYWGFGMASERLNKRVRDGAFLSLVRQEVSYFDKRSVGKITSQLQDDAACIQAFSGEPVRSFIIAIASVVTGVVLAFAFMWPFALVALACLPFMSFTASQRAKKVFGEDLGTGRGPDGLNSPGGILVETLLNIRAVSALTLEERRFEDFENALRNDEIDHVKDGLCVGLSGGAAVFLQLWVNAFLFWWGGYLLFHHPDNYTFVDFLVSNFSLLFALFGLGSALQGISDRKAAETSAGRIFYLLDRPSEIDPLSMEGKKLSLKPRRGIMNGATF